MPDSRDIEFDQILDEYKSRRALDPAYTDDDIFALFVAEGLVGERVTGSFDTDHIFVDGTHDTGIDALAIIVDNTLVEHVEDVPRLLTGRRAHDIRFVLAQVTSKKAFEVRKVEKFEDGAFAFFAEQTSSRGVVKGRRNSDIQSAAVARSEVFRLIEALRLPSPNLHLYYASRGHWQAPPNLVGRRTALIERMRRLGLFNQVTFDWIDFSAIQQARRRLRLRNRGEVRCFRLSLMSTTPAIGSAYHGAILADDLIALATTQPDGEINPNVFLDNVRGSLPENAVNAEIAQTLDAGDVDLFPLLSNGITILCRHADQLADRLVLHDYQIVNGCQTTHVIHSRASKVLGRGMLVPAKVIVTRDSTIMRRVIEASNRQTQITDENLLALQPFNRALADYYQAMAVASRDLKLYYAIRGGEDAPGFDWHTVTTVEQIQAYAAMVLECPHDVTERTRDYVSSAGTQVFAPDDKLEAYYVSALALTRWTSFAKSLTTKRSPRELRNVRFHVLFALGRLFFRPEYARLSRELVFDRCALLGDILHSQARAHRLLAAVLEVIEEAVGPEEPMRRDIFLRASFTSRVAETLEARFSTFEQLIFELTTSDREDRQSAAE